LTTYLRHVVTVLINNEVKPWREPTHPFDQSASRNVHHPAFIFRQGAVFSASGLLAVAALIPENEYEIISRTRI